MPAHLNHRQLAELLDADLGEPILRFGRSEHRRLPGGLWMATWHRAPSGDVDHLLTLVWGGRDSLTAEVAWGLIDPSEPEAVRWAGRADHRGQVRIRGLTTGEFQVRYVPWVRSAVDVHIFEVVGDKAAASLLRAAGASAPGELGGLAQRAADRLTSRPFLIAPDRQAERPSWPGRDAGLATGARTPATGSPGSPADRTEPAEGALSVRMEPGTVRSPLVRFRVLAAGHEPVVEGFVGIVWGQGTGHGETRLAAFTEWGPFDGPLWLWIKPQPIESLGRGDFEALLASETAAVAEYRSPVTRALHWLRRVFRGRLTTPAPEKAVLALLPPDDRELAALLREPLRTALRTADEESDNAAIIEAACSLLIGQASVDSSERFRLREVAARELSALHRTDAAARSSAAHSSSDTERGETDVGTAHLLMTPRLTRELPHVVKQRCDRLEALLTSDDEKDRLAGRLYLLVEIAGQDTPRVSEYLLLEPEEADRLNRYAILDVHESAASA
jgi:hypothetical protein